ncbi:MAG: hypothetical protein GY754_43260 [bacterium]|nr:hypothetical protein [bacterium]
MKKFLYVILLTVLTFSGCEAGLSNSENNDDDDEAFSFSGMYSEIKELKEEINQLKLTKGALSPTGTIVPFAGATVPSGWLLCNGSEISRDTYTDLFAAIGAAWGSGNGTSTFNIPDLRGRFLRGVDSGSGIDPDAGSRTALYSGNTGNAVGTYQSFATALPNSSFIVSDDTHTHSSTSGIFNEGPGIYAGQTAGGRDNFTNASEILNPNTHNHSISGGDTESRPVNAAVNYLIKY